MAVTNAHTGPPLLVPSHPFNFGLLARSLTRYTVRQLAYRLARPARRWNGRRVVRLGALSMPEAPMGFPLSLPTTQLDVRGIRVLGQLVDWQELERTDLYSLTRLQAYHLAYLDWFCDPTFDVDLGQRAIRWWLQRGCRSAGAWDPYPVACRVLNIVAAWPWLSGERRLVLRPLLPLLAEHVCVLASGIEFDLDGNHLIRTAAALALGASLFDSTVARRWLRRGLRIVAVEAPCQVSRDGGHLERSALYHALVLSDLWTVRVLAQSRHRSEQLFPESLNVIIAKMGEWLTTVLSLPGGVPVWGDSHIDVGELRDRLVDAGVSIAGGGPEQRDVALAETGIYATGSGCFTVRANFGSPLMRQCPAHAHADLLEVEVAHRGALLISDSGVPEYEAGPERAFYRSTKAHPTVEVDGRSQHELWGSFRMGRSGRVHDVKVSTARSWTRLEGWHDGYRFLPGSPRHLRTVIVARDQDTVEVTDEMIGRGAHEVALRWPLEPGVSLSMIADNCVAITCKQGTVRLTGAGRWEIEAGNRAPRLGTRLERPVIVAHHRGRLPARLVTRITAGP